MVVGWFFELLLPPPPFPQEDKLESARELAASVVLRPFLLKRLAMRVTKVAVGVPELQRKRFVLGCGDSVATF